MNDYCTCGLPVGVIDTEQHTMSCHYRKIVELEALLEDKHFDYSKVPDSVKRDPVRDAYLLQQGNELRRVRTQCMEYERMFAEKVNENLTLQAKIEELEAELKVAKSFHDVAVEQRDTEIKHNQALEAQLETLTKLNDQYSDDYVRDRDKIIKLEAQLAAINGFCEQFINAYPDWRDKYEALEEVGDE